MSDRGPLDFDDDHEQRWAHRRDPDLPPASREARRGQVPVPRPPGMSRYTWFVGVVGFLLVVVALVNGIRSEGPGATGVPEGERMPVFSAPLVGSDFGEDDAVNLERCDVPGEALNICELWRRGPVVLTFFATRSGGCIEQLDVIEAVRGRFPQVGFAAVSVAGGRDRARELAERRGWGFPVAYDIDGRLSSRYAVSVCPQITFAARGGKVVTTTFGELDERELATQVGRLTR